MRFSCTAGMLRDATTTARGATVSNPTLVAYTGVLYKVTGSSASVVGSDGETTIATVLEVSDAVPGSVLLPAKPISGYLATLAPDTLVRFEAEEGGDVELSVGGGSPYRFRTIASSFPLPSGSRIEMHEVNFDHLAEAVAAVKAAAGKDDAVQIVSSDEDLTLYATDSYRIGSATLEGAGFGEFRGIASCTTLASMARYGAEKIGVDPQGRMLRATGPGVVIASRLLSVAFPAVESLLANTPGHSVSVPVQQMLDAVRRLDAIADSAPLVVLLDGARLSLSAVNADLGSGEELIALGSSVSAPFEFRVNPGYLRDAISAHLSEEIRLSYSTDSAPVFMDSTGDVPVTTVVMPVRV